MTLARPHRSLISATVKTVLRLCFQSSTIVLLATIFVGSFDSARAEETPEIDPALEWLTLPVVPSDDATTGLYQFSRNRFDAGQVTFLLIATLAGGGFVLPGMVLLHASSRREELLDVALPCCLMAAAILTCVWVIFGYSLAFSRNYRSNDVEPRELHSLDPRANRGNVWIGGPEHFALRGLESHVKDESPAFPIRRPTDEVPSMLFMLFQLSVFLGATMPLFVLLDGRLSLAGRMTFVVLWGVLVYCPLVYGIWGGGWLSQTLDFGGGAVVHLSLGVSALALSIVGRRSPDPESTAGPADNHAASIGCALFWLGNPIVNAGHEMIADGTAVNALVMTHAAISVSVLGWLGTRRLLKKSVDRGDYCFGAIAGAAGIASGCGFVTFEGTIIIGVLSSVLASATWSFVSRQGRPDPLIRAFAVHGLGGLAGCLLTGVFATSAVARPRGHAREVLGLLEGASHQLLDQALAISASVLLATIGSFLAWAVARYIVQRSASACQVSRTPQTDIAEAKI